MTPSRPLAQLAVGPIFVVGHHRSGTTWVYDLLVAHPEVAGVLESQLFSRSLGLVALDRPYHWSPSAARRQRQPTGQELGLGQLVSRGRAVRDMRILAARWLSRALRPEHRFLVEKTHNPKVAGSNPPPLLTKPLLRRGFRRYGASVG